ncbi:ABC transporter ATP-binding protein [Parasulfitobacter algicola]|uniref:ABC transporter ATP-binding protein n=1 Tax=Parasulfitobacter algicola TaxID=2614809 RepID=A0ABX2ISA8_9RHOB|nr:ABC transporter ATP-binding protein [Sulfitobacter algicola]NSX55784.1 ABC transporter ATP-binding protein [Sulfitobacter algicola]
MNALDLQDIHLTLGGTSILNGVSLHVAPKEFVSILGPSGAGKSTLFRMLTGAVKPDRGNILIKGQPVAKHTRTFAFMPQRDALLPWRRIIDNITLGLEIQGVSRKAARQKALLLLSTFGLKGCEAYYPAQLSGGMRQRAALLRTLIQERPIQLLDEPFGALDALTRVTMQRWLKNRWHQARWTTLLITHDVREAVALSDRIYVLSRRPARVISELTVNTDDTRQQEARLLDILLTQTGDP